MSSRHPSHKAPESIPPQEQESTGIEAEMNPRPDYGERSYVGHNRLPNKIALVTGGDSGIGRAVCVAFAREGADILCGYHSSDVDAKETKRVVEEAGQRCVLFKGDLSEESDCRAIVEQCVQTFGRIDILVNNAAFQGKSVETFEEIPLDRVEKTFKTNIYSMFAITKFALPHMKEGSAIINTGSIQAYQPSSGILDYACTKAAIVDFTKGLAPHLIKRGIRVNCVAPGPVWTPLIVQSFPPEKVKEFGRNYPIGRPAMPVELSPAYVYLASSEADYVAGEVLGVTGGKPLA